jgi:hypothetical protein
MGWWCTGSRGEDAILCALVEAESEHKAKTYLLISWPEAGEWRFCEPHDGDWRPSDRFPLKAWMEKRLAGEVA